MLIGRIRDARTVTVDVEGDSLEEITKQLAERAPEGFELVSAPARMRKGSITLDTTGTFQARGVVQEIEGPDIDALRAQVPEGWQLLSVRTA